MRRITSLMCLAAFVFLFCSAASAGEIDPGLAEILAATASGQQVSVLVFLKDRVDLKYVSDQLTIQKVSLQSRHEAVVRTLQSKAESTQSATLANVRALTAKVGFGGYRAFWIVNAFEVTASKELVEQVANWPDVEKIFYNYGIESIAPVEINAAGQGAVAAAESGVSAIRAPEVWAMGITGQ